MGKQTWKPGNMVYPLPAVMVSCADKEGHNNIITVAWTGTVCTNPAMAYISVRPERHSYKMIRESGEFVINLTTEKLAYATDWCGVRSGRDYDKFKEMKLTASEAESLDYAPIIEEFPVVMECELLEHLKDEYVSAIVGKIVNVKAEEKVLNEKIQEEKQKKTTLKKAEKSAGSQETIESLARSDLNYLKENEIIFIDGEKTE